MNNVAMYLRKSRAEEASDTEETLARHKETLLEFAKRNKLAISHIYEEVVSGESLYSRPKMLKLLADCEAGTYDAVLCMDIDRLGRGAMSQQGIILETLKGSNTKIITPRKIYDLNNELDEEYTEFETFIARRELKLIKRRMQRGTRKTIEEGGYIANPPFGYNRVYKNKKPTLDINEEEAKYVRMIFDMYGNQGIGCHTIADTLNSMGVRPHRTDKFCRTTVRHILKNHTYIGKVVWDRKKHIRKGVQGNEKHITIYNPKEQWTIVDGLHPPIIDEDLFYRVQKIFEGRYHPPSNKGIVENPMAGLLICSVCGQKMQRRPYLKENQTAHLICPTKGCCASSRIDYVEAALLNAISDEAKSLKAGHVANNAIESDLLFQSLKSISQEIDKAMAQKNRLHDLLEQEIYDIATYSARMKILNEKISKLEESYQEMKEKIDSINQISHKERLNRIENVLQFYHSSSPQEKNDLLKSIIQKAEYFKAKGWKPTQFNLSIDFY